MDFRLEVTLGLFCWKRRRKAVPVRTSANLATKNDDVDGLQILWWGFAVTVGKSKERVRQEAALSSAQRRKTEDRMTGRKLTARVVGLVMYQEKSASGGCMIRSANSKEERKRGDWLKPKTTKVSVS